VFLKEDPYLSVGLCTGLHLISRKSETTVNTSVPRAKNKIARMTTVLFPPKKYPTGNTDSQAMMQAVKDQGQALQETPETLRSIGL
jgi:hypothetical protein